MSEDLQKQLDQAKNAYNTLNAQFDAHKEVMNSWLQDMLNGRTNFKLAAQNHQDALNKNHELSKELEALKVKYSALELENKELKASLNDCVVIDDQPVVSEII